MIDRIKKIISEIEVDHWTILEKKVESKELFFIKNELDMNRAKDVCHYQVNLYKDFEEDKKKYKGSSTVKLASTMENHEIKSILEKGAYAAGFVKNPHYPMVEPVKIDHPAIKSQFSGTNLMPFMIGLKDSIFKNDTQDNGGINSAEIFLNRSKNRLATSTGIDVSYNNYKCDIEVITDWIEDNEDVELYNMLSFSDYCPELIEDEVKTQLENSRDRAKAVKSSDIKDINIILKTDAVMEMMSFYKTQSSAQAVFEELSNAKVGEVFQGNDIVGDSITLDLDPLMKNSPYSSPIGSDGTSLKKVRVFEDGHLKQFHGSSQYASYLDIEPTGIIQNIEVKGGTIPLKDFRKEPYIEIMVFSDFQMDTLSGDFGGEIRLAKYYDGEKVIPITGVSLSSNIFEIQKEIYLSKEITQKKGYIGPEALMFRKGQISGE